MMITKNCDNCQYSRASAWQYPCFGCILCFRWKPAKESKEESPKPRPENDGSTADYYVLPEGATQLQDLISFRDMNAQLGEIFRACYRYGQGHHSPRERDLKKIIFYAQAELDRLEKYSPKINGVSPK
jgi:hypothetical protein